MNGDWWNHRSLLTLASALLMGGAVAATFFILPFPGQVPAALYGVQGSIGIGGGDGPVFILGEDRFPHQCGRARLATTGTLTLFAYADAACQAGVTDLRPHLLSADLRVAWALVPPSDRIQLRQLGIAAVDHLEDVIIRVFQAPFFAREYSDLIEDIVRNALQQAWVAPTTTQTLLRAGQTLDRKPLEDVFAGVLPIVGEKVRDNPWRTLNSALSALLGSADPEQKAALTQLVSEVLNDTRVRDHLARALPPFLSNREAVAVGKALAREASSALLADPRLPGLAGRLLTDQRFIGLRPFGVDAERLLAALPMGLLRMRFRRDHNPLAAYVLRAQLRGRRGFLVLLLSPAQEIELTQDYNLPSGPVMKRINL